MKKGCFIGTVITLTIITAIIFYLFKFYGDDILNFSKDKVVELSEYKIYQDIDNLQNRQYTDSLKIIVKNFFKNIDTLDIENQIDKIEELTDNIDVILRDEKIDSLEFIFISNNLIKYDKRKKNRN